MAQLVPALEWTEDALRLRQFMFDFWFDHGRPPTLRDAHEGVGLDRRRIVQAYKQLDLGLNVTVDLRTQNCILLKAPPFASFPTPVQLFVDDTFHSFIGCAHEVMGCSNSPQVRGKQLRFESFCECCLEPITVTMRDFEFLSIEPESTLIHVTESPWDWLVTDMISMCDATNFVIDADHAARYSRMQSKGGVTMTPHQAKDYIAFVAQQRLWDYHWPPLSMDPPAILARMTELGIDIANWQE